MLIDQWSAAMVVPSLIADARGWRNKTWVVLYFVARQRILGRALLAALAPSPRTLRWHSVPAELAVSVASGGLSVWYEIAHRQSYAPVEGFRPQPGWTVVDVGANIGAYTVWAASSMRSSGRIVAIEPNPVSHERLIQSLRHLSVQYSTVQAACGDADGEVTLFFEAGYTVSSSVVPFTAASETARVPIRRLDDVLREEAVERIDVMKIDVEGAEQLVLTGAIESLRRTQRVILETTSATEAGVRAILDAEGLHLVHEEDEHWSVPGLKLLAFQRKPLERAV